MTKMKKKQDDGVKIEEDGSLPLSSHRMASEFEDASSNEQPARTKMKTGCWDFRGRGNEDEEGISDEDELMKMNSKMQAAVSSQQEQR